MILAGIYRLLLPFCLLAFCSSSNAQEKEALPVIWNVGATGQIIPVNSRDSSLCKKIRLEKEIVRVNLYLGFAALKAEYHFRNTSDSLILLEVGLPQSGSFELGSLASANFNPPHKLRVMEDAKELKEFASVTIPGMPAQSQKPTVLYTWKQAFSPDSLRVISVYLITQNHLGRMISGGSSADGNAFGYIRASGDHWQQGDKTGALLVKLNDDLYQTDIRGLQPDSSWIGNMKQLQYSFPARNSIGDRNILIWYEGAAPDYRFEKKVIPAADTLYKILDAFSDDDFNDPAFQPIVRNHFELAKTGLTVAGVLYFLLFTIPWIILIGFIIFLLFRKKSKSDKPETAQDGLP